jgi:hypothetical protein
VERGPGSNASRNRPPWGADLEDVDDALHALPIISARTALSKTGAPLREERLDWDNESLRDAVTPVDLGGGLWGGHQVGFPADLWLTVLQTGTVRLDKRSVFRQGSEAL